MNDTLQTYRPASNWMTAALVTSLVVCFGLFAESRISQMQSQSSDLIATQTSTQETNQ